MSTQPLLKINNLKQYFPLKKQMGQEQLYVRANDDICLSINRGETIGLVGESGCGKSTLGRTLLQLNKQTEGETLYYGKDLFDVVPEYFEKAVNNMETMKKTAQDSQQKYEDYIKKPLDQHETNVVNQLKHNYISNYGLMTKVLGGYYVVNDMSSYKQILLEKINIAKKRREVLEKLEEVQLRDNASEINSLKTEIASFDKSMSDCDKRFQDLKIGLSKPADFDKYEQMLDVGVDLTRLKYSEMRKLRVDLQLIFQDPYSSLNPRMTVGQIIGEGLITHNMFKSGDPALQDYIIEIMEQCGLAGYMFHRYPHQFSGGQRQRIGIARSVALKPKFMVCDEAVSALDVSIQSQVINLLQDLKETEHLTYLFISHDLSVVKYLSDRIGVMYLGNMVELCSAKRIFENPLHPYTEALLKAIPTTDVDARGAIQPLEGDIPSPIRPPSGCKFHTRCAYTTDICKTQVPEWREVEEEHFVACHHLVDNSSK
ncbi:MAG: oligopeptide/dipeptide ABC transporter ATP-binding protein [bacterium]